MVRKSRSVIYLGIQLVCLAISTAMSVLNGKATYRLYFAVEVNGLLVRRRLDRIVHMLGLGLRVVFAVDSWLVASDRVVVLVCTLALTLVVVDEDRASMTSA
jgi:hypothetical protein